MKTIKIEVGKLYKSRDGHQIRIYSIDGGGSYPIHGAIWAGSLKYPTTEDIVSGAGEWYPLQWDNAGKGKYDSEDDIVDDITKAW